MLVSFLVFYLSATRTSERIFSSGKISADDTQLWKWKRRSAWLMLPSLTPNGKKSHYIRNFLDSPFLFNSHSTPSDIHSALLSLNLTPTCSSSSTHFQATQPHLLHLLTFSFSKSLPLLLLLIALPLFFRISSPLGDLERQLSVKWLKYKVNKGQQSWLSMKWGIMTLLLAEERLDKG